MGVMGAFVFAAQMINFTIPGTGSSGHICGGMLLTAMLGPWAGFLTMTVSSVTENAPICSVKTQAAIDAHVIFLFVAPLSGLRVFFQ
mgnify:CR=1 FL=1